MNFIPFNPFPADMRRCFRLLLAPVLAAALWLAGCAKDDGKALASELDDPNYRRAHQLLKQDRAQESLAVFLKVIALRGDEAPESHLEAGLIYRQHIKNPIRAIYHFEKYRELLPNSPKAERVREQIDAAKREFARTLPAQPMEHASDRPELLEQLVRLQRENEQLKAEVATLLAGASAPLRRSQGAITEVPTVAPSNYPRIQIEPQAAGPVMQEPARPQPVTPPITTPTRPTQPATASGRTHTVQPGEGLWPIARKYYGTSASNAKVDEIYEANRDQMKHRDDTRPGMVLRIP